MNALGKILKARIEQEGPISLYDYMESALSHPEYGYYRRQEPFGESGDFITAPEISQMFGELIGLWAVDVWIKLGSPQQFHLIELGPGNGTLMADVLRSARLVPDFLAAANIHLVETSPRLKSKQAMMLNEVTVNWHGTLPEVQDAPLILIANEFFDALPIRQYCFTQGAWREHLVTNQTNSFDLALSNEPVILDQAPAAEEGDIFETCREGEKIVSKICTNLLSAGGAALIVDYGPAESLIGDSFQALKGHRHVDPFHAPGEADLTAHVKFANFRNIATSHGITVQGPTTQGRFLERLGIEARHHLLRQKADDAQKKKLDSQLRRLTSSEEMGTLFKVLSLSHNMSRPTEGFGD